MSRTRVSRTAVLTLALAAAMTGGVTTTGSASAATATGCEGGGYTVSTGGRVVDGKLSARGLPAHALLQVRGRHTTFDVDASTFAVYRYGLTGAANPMSMTGGRAVTLFESKVPDLGTQTLDAGDLDVRVAKDTLELRRAGSAVKMKIQAKDCATGGIFQMEPEAAGPVVITHTLAAGVSYFVNPYTGKVNLGDGTQLRGKDSPQVATRLSQTGSVTVWQVAPGGRLGGVLGEDAVELSAGASPCVTDCQAQSQIQGSLPVTDPAFSG